MVDAEVGIKGSPCRESSDQSRTTGRFESLRSYNSPAAAPAPVSSQTSGSSSLHRRLRWRLGCPGAGCSPAPRTASGRGCGWGEGATASRCSSGRREKKWGIEGGVEWGWKQTKHNKYVYIFKKRGIKLKKANSEMGTWGALLPHSHFDVM